MYSASNDSIIRFTLVLAQLDRLELGPVPLCIRSERNRVQLLHDRFACRANALKSSSLGWISVWIARIVWIVGICP